MDPLLLHIFRAFLFEKRHNNQPRFCILIDLCKITLFFLLLTQSSCVSAEIINEKKLKFPCTLLKYFFFLIYLVFFYSFIRFFSQWSNLEPFLSVPLALHWSSHTMNRTIKINCLNRPSAVTRQRIAFCMQYLGNRSRDSLHQKKKKLSLVFFFESQNCNIVFAADGTLLNHGTTSLSF